MKMRHAALAGLAGMFLTATANATAFYIDQFKIMRDAAAAPGVLAPWFEDNFDDDMEPPDTNGTFPSGASGSYLTVPSPMPGPELNGKLRLDTAEGFPGYSSVSGNPIMIQRARLATNMSNADADLNRGLKETQVFEVQGTFDLIEPTAVRENYGVRVTDFGAVNPNDNVQIRVTRTEAGEWQVQFVEADFNLGIFNVIDSRTLSDITGVGSYDQIALTLIKDDPNSNLISAAFELIDLHGLAPISVSLTGTADIFNNERWTRAGFFAFAPRSVPVPATLLLVSMGLVGISHRRSSRAKVR